MTRKQKQLIDQFEAEKYLHAASTDNLVLMIIDKRPDPRATTGQPPGNSDGTNPETRAESRCKTPVVAQGGGGGRRGCWFLELTDG